MRCKCIVSAHVLEENSCYSLWYLHALSWSFWWTRGKLTHIPSATASSTSVHFSAAHAVFYWLGSPELLFPTLATVALTRWSEAVAACIHSQFYFKNKPCVMSNYQILVASKKEIGGHRIIGGGWKTWKLAPSWVWDTRPQNRYKITAASWQSNLSGT